MTSLDRAMVKDGLRALLQNLKSMPKFLRKYSTEEVEALLATIDHDSPEVKLKNPLRVVDPH